MRQSCLYNGNSYTGETTSLYWDTPLYLTRHWHRLSICCFGKDYHYIHGTVIISIRIIITVYCYHHITIVIILSTIIIIVTVIIVTATVVFIAITITILSLSYRYHHHHHHHRRRRCQVRISQLNKINIIWDNFLASVRRQVWEWPQHWCLHESLVRVFLNSVWATNYIIAYGLSRYDID